MKRMKKQTITIIVPIIIAFFLCFLLTGCGKTQVVDTIVIGNGQMSGVFSPFFSETADDQVIVKLTSMSLLRTDVNGEPQPYAATCQVLEEKDASGEVVNTTYRFKLLDGLKFSDGKPVTADDVIFSIKVLCDPTYNGLSAVGSLPIIGLEEYKYDRPDYEEAVDSIKIQAEELPDSYVKEYIMEMAKADVAAYSKEDIAAYLGIDLDPSMSEEAMTDFLINAYYEFELKYAYDYYLEGAKAAYFDQLIEEQLADHDDSIAVPEIAGVIKIDDKTVDIKLKGVNPAAIWELGDIVVAPKHYYCEDEPDGELIKGRLDGIRQRSGKPLGAGPYIFHSYENNVVTLKANENYILGKPQTENIKVVTSNASNMLDAIMLSEIDIAHVPATEDNLIKAEKNGLVAMTANFPGYGYIGINSANIYDVNVRKGLLCLMNREPAVNTYFGKLAEVIERPVSKSSWAYPEHAEPAYTYDPDQALAYFRSAGYEQTRVNGKTVLERDGVQLSLMAGVGGEGTMDHPAALVFTQMKTDLEEMGGRLEIIDADMSVLVEGLYQGSWDLWAASWELAVDPNMSSRYVTGAEGNYYGLSNAELDLMLQKADSTANMEVRKELYRDAMELIMDEAVELPLYQRQNLLVYNPDVIHSKSMPGKISEYYNFFEEIHKICLLN
jgi:peptide/nickel transport system substrate-binding protein